MNKQEPALTQLYQKFLDGNCTPGELQQLLDHFGQQGNDSPLAEQIRRHLEAPHIPVENIRLRSEKIVAETDKVIMEFAGAEAGKPARKWAHYRTIAVAAVGLLICTIAYLFWPDNRKEQPKALVSQFGGDAAAGGNKAILSLSNGKTYTLSSKQAGILVSKHGIAYEDGSTLAQNAPAETSKLSTPMGGQYTATLSDGTKVWLNAGSSIVYPNTFVGKTTRKVQLTGEAYFAVAKNKRQPFIVESEGQIVRVLGTEFNINAYKNEPVVTTTLLNGSIALSNGKSARPRHLKPNQQAIYDGKTTTVHEVDALESVAWRNGEFRFNAVPLPAILRQLERWYDIEVDYSGVPSTKVHASIRRDKNLSSVLYAIAQSTDIKFQIKGRRLSIK